MPLVCMGFVFPGDLTNAQAYERLQCMLPRLAICHAGCDGRCQGCNPVLFCHMLLVERIQVCSACHKLPARMLNARCPVMQVWFVMPFCALCLALHADLAILAREFPAAVFCVPELGAPHAFSRYGIRFPW